MKTRSKPRTWTWKSSSPSVARLPVRNWEPMPLRPKSVTAIMAAHVAFVAVIAALVAATYYLDGFVEVRENTSLSSVFRTVRTDMSLLWTALPPFIFQAFVLCRNWALDDAVVREPFAELGVVARESMRRGDGKRVGNGLTSMMRDYRTEMLATRWVSTSKDGHWHLTVGLILSLSFNLLMVPLVASMFYVRTVSPVEDIRIAQPSVFDENFAGAPVAKWSQTLDAVTSEVLYGGRHLSWTNASHAFQPFQPVAPLPDQALVKAPSVAYSGHLSCVLIPKEDMTVRSEQSETAPAATVRFNVTDRGCDIKSSFNIFGNTPLKSKRLYFESRYQRDCSLSANLTRMYFIAATTVGEVRPEIEQMHFVSCITGYGTTPGKLSVLWTNETNSSPAASPPRFVDFAAASGTTVVQVEQNDRFEHGLLITSSLQAVSPTEFGNLVLQVALKLLPAERRSGADPTRDVLTSPPILLEAIPQTFAYVYRAAISQFGFVALPQESAVQPVSATLMSPRPRLAIRYEIAAVLLFFLLASLFSTVWLLLNRISRPQPLGEEPAGIMSYVGLLLHDTDRNIAEMVRDVTTSDDFDGKFVQTAQKRWNIEEATFFVTETGEDKNVALRVENLRRRHDFEDTKETKKDETKEDATVDEVSLS
jgi:hypothetical protein